MTLIFPIIFLIMMLKRKGLRKRERQCATAAAGRDWLAVTANGIIVRAVAYAKQENGESRDKGKGRGHREILGSDAQRRKAGLRNWN